MFKKYKYEALKLKEIRTGFASPKYLSIILIILENINALKNINLNVFHIISFKKILIYVCSVMKFYFIKSYYHFFSINKNLKKFINYY